MTARKPSKLTDDKMTTRKPETVEESVDLALDAAEK